MFFNILANEPILVSYNPSAGRFYPLAFWDLNILMQFSNSIKLFFLANALEFMAMAVIVSILCYKIWDSFKVLLFTLFIIFINVGFVIIITGICYPEKLEMLFLCIFILTFYYTLQNGSKLLALLCFLSAFISLFYKETAFIFISSFAFFYILFSYLQSCISKTAKPNIISFLKQRDSLLALSLLVAGIIFIALYAILVLPHIESSYINDHSQKNAMLIIRDIINVFLHHPFIFILIPFILFLRFRDFRHTNIFYPLQDSLLLAALLGGFSYFVLGILNVYYFMPCYIIAFLGVLFFAKKYFKKLKILLLMLLLLHCIINIPLALSTYTRTKLLPPNYAKAMSFMADYTKARDNTAIFLLGQNRDPDGLMFYDFARRFLEHYGAKSFDLQTLMDNPALEIKLDSSSKFSIFNSYSVNTPKSGDLLYLDSFGKDFVDEAYLNMLNNRYQLIFESSYMGFYNLNVKSILKYFAMDSSAYKAYQNKPRVSSNIFNAPLFVRVYRVP